MIIIMNIITYLSVFCLMFGSIQQVILTNFNWDLIKASALLMVTVLHLGGSPVAQFYYNFAWATRIIN